MPTYNVCVLLPWLGPDAAHWLGVFRRLFIRQVVDNLTGGRVHYLDTSINESNTDITAILGVSQTENFTPALNRVQNTNIPVSYRTAKVCSAKEGPGASGHLGANTGVSAADTTPLP